MGRQAFDLPWFIPPRAFSAPGNLTAFCMQAGFCCQVSAIRNKDDLLSSDSVSPLSSRRGVFPLQKMHEGLLPLQILGIGEAY